VVLGECLDLLALGDVIAHGLAEMAVVMAAVSFPLLLSRWEEDGHERL